MDITAQFHKYAAVAKQLDTLVASEAITYHSPSPMIIMAGDLVRTFFILHANFLQASTASRYA